MQIHIRYLSILADYAGAHTADLDLPDGMSARALMVRLTEVNPLAFRRALADGALGTYVRIFRNQQMISGSAMDAPLIAGDEIWLVPAVSGGTARIGRHCAYSGGDPGRCHPKREFDIV